MKRVYFVSTFFIVDTDAMEWQKGTYKGRRKKAGLDDEIL